MSVLLLVDGVSNLLLADGSNLLLTSEVAVPDLPAYQARYVLDGRRIYEAAGTRTYELGRT